MPNFYIKFQNVQKHQDIFVCLIYNFWKIKYGKKIFLALKK